MAPPRQPAGTGTATTPGCPATTVPLLLRREKSGRLRGVQDPNATASGAGVTPGSDAAQLQPNAAARTAAGTAFPPPEALGHGARKPTARGDSQDDLLAHGTGRDGK